MDVHPLLFQLMLIQHSRRCDTKIDPSSVMAKNKLILNSNQKMNNPDLSPADAAMIEKRMQLVEVEQAATYFQFLHSYLQNIKSSGAELFCVLCQDVPFKET